MRRHERAGEFALSKFIGAHVSTEGGIANAPLEARRIGATAFALFTRNQKTWRSPPLADEAIERFRANCAATGYGPRAILPHASYLLNLGSAEPEILSRSREAFIDEMRRCELLGLNLLNFHPGAHKGLASDEQCLDTVAESINLALAQTRGVTAVVEITAGQGTCVGRTLEQLAYLLERVDDADRAGVCVDTAHAFGAGYDLRTEADYRELMAALGRTVGFARLCGVHLNDTACGLGSRKDRHASLGDGEIGWHVFRCLLRDPRTDGVPLILETPDPGRWAAEIATLAGFASSALSG
jgi:deoxyribonuclease IV